MICSYRFIDHILAKCGSTAKCSGKNCSAVQGICLIIHRFEFTQQKKPLKKIVESNVETTIGLQHKDSEICFCCCFNQTGPQKK